MRRRVRFHDDFRADLRSHLQWCSRERDERYLARLGDGVREAVRLVERFPAAGVIEDRRGSVVLRRLILRHLPYVVWYAVDESSTKRDAWFLRLFHARQERPLS